MVGSKDLFLPESHYSKSTFNTWASTAFEDSRAKTTRLHVALRTRNSSAESGRELFKGSKRCGKSSSQHFKKDFLLGVCGFFMSDVVCGGLLGHLGPLQLALSPNH